MDHRIIEEPRRIVVVDGDGPFVGGADATDLIGVAGSEDADVIAVTTARLDPEFFRLASGVAGELAGKLNQYGLALVVVGDVGEHVAASTAFSGLVAEARRPRSLLAFVDDEAGLIARAGALPTR